MQLIALTSDKKKAIQQCAKLLYESFKETNPAAWPTIEDALEEVHESLAHDRISRIALDENVIGWIGAIDSYSGHAWELHPLVVSASHRKQGIGRTLVKDLEMILREKGAVTLYLCTDDESGSTSLANKNLYPDVFTHIAKIENHKNHPFTFYQKIGFTIVGVIPDANGIGKPDIFMAKRIG